MTSILDALVTGLVYGGIYNLFALDLIIAYVFARAIIMAYQQLLIVAE